MIQFQDFPKPVQPFLTNLLNDKAGPAQIILIYVYSIGFKFKKHFGLIELQETVKHSSLALFNYRFNRSTF